MNELSDLKYNQAKEKATQFFSNNRKITSICLGAVHLNSNGFMHLIWRNQSKKHKRSSINQIKRFHLLSYLKPILQGMKYYQEYCESLEKIRCKKKGRITYENKIVHYWAFIAIIDNKIRIKIILRKIGNGNIHFWSIIPIWKTSHYKNIKLITLHKGNLTED